MKQKIILVTTLLILTIASFSYLSRRDQQKNENIQPKVEQVSWKDIKAGETTTQDLEKIGEPKERKTTENGETFLYATNNEYLTNEIEIKDNKVTFIKEKLYSIKDRSLKNKTETLGNSYTILYGPDSNSGITLVAYPEKGIAYLANQLGDYLFETWYFPPSDITTLLSLPELKGYSTEETQRID